MAEDNGKNITPTATPIPEASRTTAEPTPREESKPSTTERQTTPQATSEDNSSAPKKHVSVSQDTSLSVSEMKNKLRREVLSVTEAAELQNKINDNEGEGDGETNKLNDDDIQGDDEKADRFNEEDIIRYMYNKWLIAAFCEAGAKIKKYGNGGLARLERHLINEKKDHERDKKAFEESNTNKVFKAVHPFSEKLSKKVEEDSEKKNREIKDLSSSIREGEISDKNAELLLKLAKYRGVDASNVKDDAFISGIIEKSIKMRALKERLHQNLGLKEEQVKEDPSLVKKQMKKLKKDKNQKDLYDQCQNIQKDIKEVQTQLDTAGKTFAEQELRKNTYDNKLDQTAILMTEAHMLDNIIHNSSAYKAEDATKIFSTELEKNREKLRKATRAEENDYVKGTKQKTKNGKYATSIFAEASSPKLDNYYNLADQADNEAIAAIKSKKAVEFDKKARENKPLKNLEEAAKDNADREDILQKARQDIQQRMSTISEAEARHMQSPIAARIHQMQQKHRKDAIDKGAKNNFQDWSYKPAGRE